MESFLRIVLLKDGRKDYGASWEKIPTYRRLGYRVVIERERR